MPFPIGMLRLRIRLFVDSRSTLQPDDFKSVTIEFSADGSDPKKKTAKDPFFVGRDFTRLDWEDPVIFRHLSIDTRTVKIKFRLKHDCLFKDPLNSLPVGCIHWRFENPSYTLHVLLIPVRMPHFAFPRQNPSREWTMRVHGTPPPPPFSFFRRTPDRRCGVSFFWCGAWWLTQSSSGVSWPEIVFNEEDFGGTDPFDRTVALRFSLSGDVQDTSFSTLLSLEGGLIGTSIVPGGWLRLSAPLVRRTFWTISEVAGPNPYKLFRAMEITFTGESDSRVRDLFAQFTNKVAFNPDRSGFDNLEELQRRAADLTLDSKKFWIVGMALTDATEVRRLSRIAAQCVDLPLYFVVAGPDGAETRSALNAVALAAKNVESIENVPKFKWRKLPQCVNRWALQFGVGKPELWKIRAHFNLNDGLTGLGNVLRLIGMESFPVRSSDTESSRGKAPDKVTREVIAAAIESALSEFKIIPQYHRGQGGSNDSIYNHVRLFCQSCLPEAE
jgi:hypothetical protein